MHNSFFKYIKFMLACGFRISLIFLLNYNHVMANAAGNDETTIASGDIMDEIFTPNVNFSVSDNLIFGGDHIVTISNVVYPTINLVRTSFPSQGSLKYNYLENKDINFDIGETNLKIKLLAISSPFNDEPTVQTSTLKAGYSIYADVIDIYQDGWLSEAIFNVESNTVINALITKTSENHIGIVGIVDILAPSS